MKNPPRRSAETLEEKRARLTRLLRRRARPRHYPLSYSQQRLWFLDQMDPGSAAYNVRNAVRLGGALEPGILAASLREVVRRHKSLRTGFGTVDGRPVQMISPPAETRLPSIDLSGLGESVRASEARRIVERLFHHRFDLSRGGLLRALLCRLGPREHVLAVVMHHIVSDAWSIGIFIRELCLLYTAFAAGRPSPLAELAVDYVDYAAWQRKALTGERLEAALGYWKERLAGRLPVLELPRDRPRPAVPTLAGAIAAFGLSPLLSTAIGALCRRHGVTLFMSALAAFTALLSRYTGQEDVLLGVPVAGRGDPRTAPLIGFFVNTLVLRIDLGKLRRDTRRAGGGEAAFADLLERARAETSSAFAHQDLPFEKLVEELRPERDLSRSPLVQAMLVVQSSAQESAGVAELEIEPFGVENRTSKFDLTLGLRQAGRGLAGSVEFSLDLFDPTTIRRLIRHFETFLDGAAAEPRRPLADLPLLTPGERHQVQAEWNAAPAGSRAPLADSLLHGGAEDRAARAGDGVAVVHGERALSYAALDARAERLGASLRALGVGPDVEVAISVERSLELIVGVLAILKAGGAYLPLDPRLPASRRSLLLRDAHSGGAPPVLLCHSSESPAYESGAAPEGLRVVHLDAEPPPVAATARPALHPDNLAYVIYTSGSTGAPKGVAVTHRAAVHSTAARFEVYPERVSSFLLLPSMAFDSSVAVVYWTLAAGGTLALPERGADRDPAALAGLLHRHKVSHWLSVPSLYAMVLGESGGDPGALETVVVAGEPCPPALVVLHRERCPRAALYNEYGPTECAVWSTVYACREAAAGRVPIGRAIPACRVDVLDRAGRPVPALVEGELAVATSALARGYRRRGGPTAEKFVPDAFGGVPGARRYLTGDRVRRRRDGELEFLGRVDHQVKLRGFRIELGEIESALARHPAVRECTVLVHGDDGGQRIAAWLTAEGEAPADAELRAFLKERLPDYMVPAHFRVLADLPRTATGKVDRRALPAIDRHRGGGDFVGPSNEIEAAVAKIWCQVLGIDRVGRDDNFFDLGGHSLLVVRVRDRIEEELGRRLSIPELFQHTNVRTLAEHLSASPPAAAKRRATAVRDGHTGAPAGIAVVGMAGRFPGAESLEDFWRNLAAGVESVSSFTDEELLDSGIDRRIFQDPSYVKARATLGDTTLFDAELFGYSPREAEVIDPQHRLFLETCWETLENAGYDSARYPGRIGVYGGMSMSTYALRILTRLDVVAALGRQQVVLSNDKDYLCSRVAYKLDLHGPAVGVQTACSTSLVAVHLACQAILAGECDMALAGGVTLNFPQKTGYRYQEHGIASRDGHCRAFDARASGTVGGEGVGAVLLKPLAQALADGDTVHAVLRGSGLNNDGLLKAGFTAPSIPGQARAIADAYRAAGVEEASVGYIETHGTATAVGDPIEVAALNRVFAGAGPGTCALGSVKSNIGHLDAAAGIAGLIKTVLALRHRQLPPSLHFEEPNPEIDFSAGPFYVNRELADWPRREGPRRAGVSSFGLGGTNVHVVVEEAPESPPSEAGAPWHLLPLSARTESALGAVTERLAAHLRDRPELDLADVAHTCQVGRRPFRRRSFLVARETAEAARILAGAEPGRLLSATAPESARSVAFLLPGLGDHYAGMGAGLYRTLPSFREELDRCAELLQPLVGVDLREVLGVDPENGDGASGTAGAEAPGTLDLRRLLGRGGGPSSSAAGELARTRIAQPALFAVEYALAKALVRLGIRPTALVGYSLGEYVAACLAGVLSLADVLTLVAGRARLIDALPEGAMVAVSLDEEQVRGYLGAELDLAARNAPGTCVVGGDPKGVAALEERLANEGVVFRRLRTSHAFHSRKMRPIVEPFSRLVAGVELGAPRIPYLSNLTGTWIRGGEAADPEYWTRHLLEPVRFDSAAAELWRQPGRILLEVGPGRALGSLALQAPGGAEAARPGEERLALASLRHEYESSPDLAFLLRTLGQLWLAGVEIDWSALHGGVRRCRVELPTYPFERRRYWLETGDAPATAETPGRGKKSDMADWFYVPAWKATARRTVAPRGEAPRRWVVFLDEPGVGDRLLESLEARGHDVTGVRAGRAFARDGKKRFRLDPACREDYERLFDALDPPPENVVHLWSLGGEGAGGTLDPGSFDEAQVRGFYSLLYTAQALARLGAGQRKVFLIADGLCAVERSDRLAPAKATVLGPVKVIAHEYEGLRCRAIDVVPRDLEGEGLEGLLAELAEESGPPVVARRGAERWVRAAEPLRLPPLDAAPPRLRRRGVYLVTGGLGGIGLALAEHLVATLEARVILLGRSGLPEAGREPDERRIRQAAALERMGDRVLLIRADVTDEAAMRNAADRIGERCDRLDGVFHTAGVAGAGLLQLKTRDAAERVMAPKTHGSLLLERTLAPLAPAFVVHFSSLSAYTGGIGQVDYCAANAFLGALAQNRRHEAAPPIVTVDWCEWQWNAWAEETSRLDHGIRAELERRRRELGLSFEEGLEALERVLASGLPQVIVSTGSLKADTEEPVPLPELLRTLGSGEDGGPAHVLHDRPNLGTPYVAPDGELEEKLAEIWQELLGIEKVGARDNFFELGGHSLLGLQVLARLRDGMRVELPLRTFFESPTIAELAEVVRLGAEDRDRAGATPIVPEIRGEKRRDARGLLKNIDRLSEAETEALLDEMMAERNRAL